MRTVVISFLIAIGSAGCSGPPANSQKVNYPPRQQVSKKPTMQMQEQVETPENRFIEISERIQFQTGSARLLRRSEAVLDEVVLALRENRHIRRVQVEGHTDDRGSDQENLDLSERRARAVRDYLISRGVSAERLQVRGYGARRPLTHNTTQEGRRRNRRVEFKIIEENLTDPGQRSGMDRTMDYKAERLEGGYQ